MQTFQPHSVQVPAASRLERRADAIVDRVRTDLPFRALDGPRLRANHTSLSPLKRWSLPERKFLY